MFATITLNPALDCTWTVEGELKVGCVHKVVAESIMPGGKGVNVAKAIAGSGKDVVAGGILGLGEVKLYTTFLEELNIKYNFMTIHQPTRRNLMLVDNSGNELKVNHPGFPDLQYDAQKLADYCLDLVKPCEVVVLSGSLPIRFPNDTYAHLIGLFKSEGKKVVLDTSGRALMTGVVALPDIIKPNRSELKDILGFYPDSKSCMIMELRNLAQRHKVVIVTEGSVGAWFASGEDVFFGVAPSVRVVETTGAGDALLGKFCAEYFGDSDGCLSEELMAMSIAAGSACVEHKGTPALENARINELASAVEIRREG